MASVTKQAEVVDGSALEGGGQVVRASSALCAMGRRQLRIENIRGGRPKPGLAAQHLASLRLVAEASGASKLEGDFKGSLGCELTYEEQQQEIIPSSHMTADSGTAGSTMLMLQAVLPVCVGRRSKVELTL
jgi:RNA 3'-terminal phosphate cyclase (ATP)